VLAPVLAQLPAPHPDGYLAVAAAGAAPILSAHFPAEPVQLGSFATRTSADAAIRRVERRARQRQALLKAAVVARRRCRPARSSSTIR